MVCVKWEQVERGSEGADGSSDAWVSKARSFTATDDAHQFTNTLRRAQYVRNVRSRVSS